MWMRERSVRIGDVVICKIQSRRDFKDFVNELKLQEKGFVIKPNWSNANTYTSAKTLEFLFDSLDGAKTVIEGYTAWRNQLNTGPEPTDFITPKNAKQKWKWIKEQDAWFLEYSGVMEVLRKYGVEYVNVTEEVWSNRIANAEEIKSLVEERFGSVARQEMYGFVPQKIYNLRECTLISLNLTRRTRELLSLSTKNMFGLIPDPARYGKWHGENDTLLPQSIVDINKIYRTLFKTCFWINELKERNLIVGSKNSVQADAATSYIMGIDPFKIEYLKLAAKIFGGYNKSLLAKIPSHLIQPA